MGVKQTSSSEALVSVIMPTYNCGSFIVESLNSVLTQTHRNLEVYVIDDGSTDDTESIVREIINTDRRVKYVYQNNSGSCVARNNGIARASGRYISLLDSDDIWPDIKIECQLTALEQSDDTIVIGNILRFRDDDSGRVFYDESTPPVNIKREDYIKKLLGMIDKQKVIFNTLL